MGKKDFQSKFFERPQWAIALQETMQQRNVRSESLTGLTWLAWWFAVGGRSCCLHCLRDEVSECKNLLSPWSRFKSKRRKSKTEIFFDSNAGSFPTGRCGFSCVLRGGLYLVQDVNVVVFSGEGGVVVSQPVHHGAAGDDDGRKQRADAVFKCRQLEKRK